MMGLGRPVGAAVACPNGKQLNIVAHEDDDLLFLNPDIVTAVRAGKCVRTVAVTAGDAGGDASYWRSRERGARAAYANMANVSNSWSVGTTNLNGRPLATSTLNANPKVSLIFMRLPDGNGGGEGFDSNNYASLQKLWFSKINSMQTVDGTANYDKQGLANTLTAVLADYQTSDVRTQNFNGYFDEGDHSDHEATAFFVRLAQQQYASNTTLSGYLGYQSADMPINVSGNNLTLKSNAFFAYGRYDDGVCDSWATCDGDMYGDWLRRQYVVGQQPKSTIPTGGSNVARQASATASSEESGSGQTAAKAIDGSTEGFPLDYTREWASSDGGAGTWFNLHWSTPKTINRVVLYDRPNADDQITHATLRFSDGSTRSVGTLYNNGWPLVISFSNKTTTDVRLTVDTVSGATANVGLSEIEAWTP
jgi:LmbE family N-acetylglucosaminyl deacetylase